jgi:hypothetical protein
MEDRIDNLRHSGGATRSPPKPDYVEQSLVWLWNVPEDWKHSKNSTEPPH